MRSVDSLESELAKYRLQLDSALKERAELGIQSVGLARQNKKLRKSATETSKIKTQIRALDQELAFLSTQVQSMKCEASQWQFQKDHLIKFANSKRIQNKRERQQQQRFQQILA